MNTTEIRVYRDLMGENDKWAAKTRKLLADKHLRMINIIGSPGCGKTTLLEKTVGNGGPALASAKLAIASEVGSVRAASKGIRFAVLEGDIETTRDAERLARLGVTASQLLTGGSCHLEAKMVHHALVDLPLDKLDLVVVENVGNLVCPAEFDIGENAKVAVLSVTEGEDKPLKYPLLFREAKAIVLTKVDLLPYLPFKLELCIEHIRQVNPSIPVFQVSALTGKGLAEWCGWLAG